MMYSLTVMERKPCLQKVVKLEQTLELDLLHILNLAQEWIIKWRLLLCKESRQSNASIEVKIDGAGRLESRRMSDDIKAIAADACAFTFGDDKDFESEWSTIEIHLVSTFVFQTLVVEQFGNNFSLLFLYSSCFRWESIFIESIEFVYIFWSHWLSPLQVSIDHNSLTLHPTILLY